MSDDYAYARSTIRYAEEMVKLNLNTFSNVALKEILKWVVMPAGGERKEPRMFSEMLQRADDEIRARNFRRGPYAPPKFTHYRQVEEETLAEFARLIREEAFNEYRAQNEQAVRP